MEFHVSRHARDYYHFDQSLFEFNGNVIFANFHAARSFAQKMNQNRDLIHNPEQAVKSSEINVQTFKGRVQLSGFVSSSTDAKRAVELTRQVQGVRLVENDMKIK